MAVAQAGPGLAAAKAPPDALAKLNTHQNEAIDLGALLNVKGMIRATADNFTRAYLSGPLMATGQIRDMMAVGITPPIFATLLATVHAATDPQDLRTRLEAVGLIIPPGIGLE